MSDKPLGRKNYGSIPHLPGSRMGPSDHHCHEGQARIATVKTRDKHDEVIVTEKLDGSNVGVARVGDTLYPIGRAGHLAASSPYEQHRLFADWAYYNYVRFMEVLQDGERLIGEWLAQAHGTQYMLLHEPFVALDLMRGDKRASYEELVFRVALKGHFTLPTVLHQGEAYSVAAALEALGGSAITGCYGYHGAIDPVEGAVWRVERYGRFDFMTKYVRPDKVDGRYLPEISGLNPIWNWRPVKGEG